MLIECTSSLRYNHNNFNVAGISDRTYWEDMLIIVGCLNLTGSESVNHAVNAGDNFNSVQKRCV